MTMNDQWLVDRARRNSTITASLKQRLEAIFEGEIDALWSALGNETIRQAGVYNDAIGNPEALAVGVGDDTVLVVVADGREVEIRLHREQRAMTERYLDRGGVMRVRRPRIKFSVNAAGKLSFNFGGVDAAAGSILRRVIA